MGDGGRSLVLSPLRLREARRQAGLTQVQVAKALGRPQSFVTKCELGERRLDLVDLHRFAKVYRKPLSFFLPPKRGRRGDPTSV